MIIEITSVSPEIFVVLPRYRYFKALVFPVPDKLTRQRGVMLIEIEHLPHIAHGITHGMAVLTLDMRTGIILLQSVLADLSDMVVAAIHGAAHVTPPAVALVMGQTGLVQCLDRPLHMLKVVASARLIAIRPHEDGDVVAHPLHMIVITFNHRPAEQLHAGESHITVCLHIGFSQYIEAIFVA